MVPIRMTFPGCSTNSVIGVSPSPVPSPVGISISPTGLPSGPTTMTRVGADVLGEPPVELVDSVMAPYWPRNSVDAHGGWRQAPFP